MEDKVVLQKGLRKIKIAYTVWRGLFGGPIVAALAYYQANSFEREIVDNNFEIDMNNLKDLLNKTKEEMEDQE